MTAVSKHDSSEAFPTTLWSIATHTRTTQARAPREAFSELCLAYWYPVYAYVRRSGHPPRIALDIARSFLAHLLHVVRSGPQQVPSERFRHFLLAHLNTFLAGDWSDTRDDALPEATLQDAEGESRYRRYSVQATSPEQAFQRGFALEILARAARRLSGEAEQAGHPDMYELLAPFLVRDFLPGQSEVIARQLHTRALVIVLALRRLRQRFRELAGEELADTVISAGDFAAEQQMLCAILQPSH